MDEVVIISVDSHAQPLPAMWAQYLEKRYHQLLPSLRQENSRFTEIFGGLVLDRIYSAVEVFDRDHIFREGGARGLYDLDVRLAEMDREGIAAEYVYFGDPRAVSLFFANSNQKYQPDVVEAGIRAWHRWLDDAFGSATDRLLLVGVVGCGPCFDMEATLNELAWISDHGFVGTFLPGFTRYPGQPPLFDEFWEPFWSSCEARDLALFLHAGYGPEQGPFAADVAALHEEIQTSGGMTKELLERRTTDILTNEFFSKLKTRRPLWQLMLGGVFDRHPKLKFVMTEIRADWLPATLQHLEAVYREHREDLPARRSPTDYWHSNCFTSLSFVHRSEMAMRHEIGVEQIAFGRDYPHPEGTWPNTTEWLKDALIGVPEDEARLMLGENAIRFFGLDGPKLVRIAERVGPTMDEITGGPDVDPALLTHFDLRGGYLKPPEADANLDSVDAIVREDMTLLAP